MESTSHGPRGAKAAARRASANTYHHGGLRGALLAAADQILEKDGLQAVTLRAVARKAGVSHAAPKNHFNGIAGLLSELATLGFARFRAEMLKDVGDAPPPLRRILVGRGYVRFARQCPGMFRLMFGNDRLDRAHPGLREASDAAGQVLASAAARDGPVRDPGEPGHMVQMIGAWSKVHGLATLMLDGQLHLAIAGLPAGMTEEDLVNRVIGGTGDIFSHR